jgi:hypothetical protein
MDNREARIRQRAHEIWEQAGRPQNKADEHWREAERQVGKEGVEKDAEQLANEPNPRHEAIDIGPGPGGRDIHPIPAAQRRG